MNSKILRIILGSICIIAIICAFVLPIISFSSMTLNAKFNVFNVTSVDGQTVMGTDNCAALKLLGMIFYVSCAVLWFLLALFALILPLNKKVPGIIGIIVGALTFISTLIFMFIMINYCKGFSEMYLNDLMRCRPGIMVFALPVLCIAMIVLAVLLLASKSKETNTVKAVPGGNGAQPMNPPVRPVYPQNNNVPAAFIVGLNGTYQNARFNVTDGTPVMFGRDASTCSVVFDQFETAVSRQHCIVKFLPNANMYSVRDMSKNGTFIGSINNRMPNNVEQNVQKGTIIYIGSSKNSFKLD